MGAGSYPATHPPLTHHSPTTHPPLPAQVTLSIQQPIAAIICGPPRVPQGYLKTNNDTMNHPALGVQRVTNTIHGWTPRVPGTVTGVDADMIVYLFYYGVPWPRKPLPVNSAWGGVGQLTMGHIP